MSSGVASYRKERGPRGHLRPLSDHDHRPPKVTAGAAAGSTASATVEGTDRGGVVTLTLSASRTADETIFAIAFASKFHAAPVVIVEAPASVRTAEIVATEAIWSLDEDDVTREGFTAKCINGDTVPGANGSSQRWRYTVVPR